MTRAKASVWPVPQDSPVSFLVHGVLIGAMVVSLPDPEQFAQQEIVSLPVDIISEEEFSTITRGSETAEQMPEEAPSVGISDEAANTNTEGAGNQDSREAAEEANANPTPEAAEPPPPPPAPEPEPTPEPEPEPAPAPEPEPAPEPIPEPEPEPAPEAVEQTPQRAVAASVPVPAPAPPRRARPVEQESAQNEEDFDEERIAALINRAENTGGGGANDGRPATLGTATGTAPELTASELDALRRQIRRCWNPPVGAAGVATLTARVNFTLNQDGSLSSSPTLLNASPDPTFIALADSAVRAVNRCAPYSLPFEKYESWKDVTVNFTPQDMF